MLVLISTFLHETLSLSSVKILHDSASKTTMIDKTYSSGMSQSCGSKGNENWQMDMTNNMNLLMNLNLFIALLTPTMQD